MGSVIYDHLGRPVRLSDLPREQAPTSAYGGVRQPFAELVWPGMRPADLAAILDETSSGEGRRYLMMASELETRDLQFRNALAQRKTAVLSMDYGVHPASDDPVDVRIAEELEGLVREADFRTLLFDCLDGISKGFSCSEITWEASARQWWPKFEHRPAHFFRLDRNTARELRLVDLEQSENGLELRPYKWVTHVPRTMSAHPLMTGLARPVSVFHLFKSLALRDWVVYAEVFGMPIRVGKYPAGATSQDIQTLKRAVQQLGSDAFAVMADTMSLELKGVAGGGGADVQERLARYCDEQISKGVVGQTMTSDDGSSRAQAEVHERVLQMFGRSDSESLVNTITRDVIAPYVALNHGADRALPRFFMVAPERRDVQAFATAILPFMEAGLEVPTRFIRELFGVPERDADEPALGGSAGPAPPVPGAPAPRPAPRAEAANAAVLALQAQARRDIVDRIAEEFASEWRPVLASEETAIAMLESAYRTGGPDAVRTMLDRIEEDGVVDGRALLQRLAVANFIARGIGDATDSTR